MTSKHVKSDIVVKADNTVYSDVWADAQHLVADGAEEELIQRMRRMLSSRELETVHDETIGHVWRLVFEELRSPVARQALVHIHQENKHG